MTIGIDGNEANVEKLVGVSVYTQQILKYAQKIANKNLKFIIFLKNQPNKSLPQETEFYSYQVIQARFLWSQIFLPFYLFKNKNIDVFFAPAHYAPRFLNVPLVLTIHDLSYFYFPNEFLKKDLYKLRNWTEYSIKKSSKVIAVSKRTKKDIQRFYPEKTELTEVIYNGFEKQITIEITKTSILKELQLQAQDYILYVGTLQPRKNILRLIKTFYNIVTFNKKSLKLVIAGKKGWLYDDIYNEVKKLKLENKVIFTDYLPDEKIVELYKNALCFVMPSLYEGFGIPILEAMSFNVPVVSSNSSSLPEIGGDACLYFDPMDENDMTQKILTIINDPSLRKNLIQLGKDRVKFFSWEKCAENTISLIKSVV